MGKYVETPDVYAPEIERDTIRRTHAHGVNYDFWAGVLIASVVWFTIGLFAVDYLVSHIK